MLDQEICVRTWLAELATITAEIEARKMPAPAPRPARKRACKRKPL